MNFHPISFSPGERALGLALGVIGLAGGLAAVTAVRFLTGAPIGQSHLIWCTFSGLVGAVWSTILCLKWMGHRGAIGWAQFTLALAGITFMTSLVAGSLILPIYGTMFGPFSAAMMFIDAPLVALAWCGATLCGHLIIIKWRQERDTIFEYTTPKPEVAQRP